MRLKQFIDLINEDIELLFELRNVANAQEMKDILADIAARIRSPMHQKWFIKNGLKHFVNHGEAIQITDPRQLNKIFGIPNVPEWAKQAIQTPDGLWEIQMSQEEYSELDGMVDWVNTLPEKPIQMDFTRAKAASDEWHARFAQQQAGTVEQETDVKPIMEFPDGYRWVELLSHNALSVESDKMGHCIGGELCDITKTRKVETSYWPLIERGAARALSLRDPKNDPHITVELSGNYDSKELQHKAVGVMAQKYGIDAQGRQPYEVWQELQGKLGEQPAKDELNVVFLSLIPVPDEWGVRQIKGKQNNKPIAKYQPYLTKLLNDLRMPIFADKHHHDAPRMRHRQNQWIDLSALKKDGNLHFYNDLSIEDKEGVYRFKDVSSERESRGDPFELEYSGQGDFKIVNTDVRYIGNVNVGELTLEKVPNLTFRGEHVETAEAFMGSSEKKTVYIRDSKVTFDRKVKSFEYSGIEIDRSTVLNMPPFHNSRSSPRGNVNISQSTVEFPEVPVSLQEPKLWGSLGRMVFIRNSEVRLPKALGAGDRIEIEHSKVNFDDVEWINLAQGQGLLYLVGVPFMKLPKKLVAKTIWTDRPDAVAEMVHNGVQLGAKGSAEVELQGYIKNGRGVEVYQVTRINGKNHIKKVEK